MRGSGKQVTLLNKRKQQRSCVVGQEKEANKSHHHQMRGTGKGVASSNERKWQTSLNKRMHGTRGSSKQVASSNERKWQTSCFVKGAVANESICVISLKSCQWVLLKEIKPKICRQVISFDSFNKVSCK